MLAATELFGLGAVDEQARPVAVLVTASPIESVCEKPGRNEAVSVSAKSDAQGRFRLSLGSSGFWNLSLQAAGFAPFATEALIGPYDEVVGPFTLRRETVPRPGGKAPAGAGPAAPMSTRRTGKVVSEPGGAPVAGSLIWLPSNPACNTHSLPDGSFDLPVPAPDEPLLATAAGFSQESLVSGEAGADSGLSAFRLRRLPGRVWGRVVDRGGRGIGFAVVKALPVGRAMVTGADGTFSLEGLPGSTDLLVEASASGYNTSALRVHLPTKGPAQDAGSLVLDRVRQVEGRLVSQTGRPLAEAWVSAQSRSGDRFQSPVDPQGMFRLGPLPPGPWFISISLQGRSFKTMEIAVPPGEGSFLLAPIEVAGEALLSGVVVAHGRPVEGARVFLRHPEDAVRRQGTGAPREIPNATSGADGRFETDLSSSAGTLDLEVWKEGYRPAHIALSRQRIEDGLEISLEKAATIEGIVTSEDGDPIIGATVVTQLPELQTQGTMTKAFLHTDKEGRFVVPSVVPGTHSITVQAEGFGTERQDFSIGDEEDRKQIRFILRDEAVLAGHVVDEQGKPVADAVVAMTSPGRPTALPVQDSTSADGSFRLEMLRPEKVSLSVTQQTCKPVTLTADLSPGRQEIRIVLERRKVYVVSGYLLDQEGRALAGAKVHLLNVETGVSYASTTDPSGSFSLDGVPEGRAQLSVEGRVLPPEEAALQLDRHQVGLILHALPPVEKSGLRSPGKRTPQESGSHVRIP